MLVAEWQGCEVVELSGYIWEAGKNQVLDLPIRPLL